MPLKKVDQKELDECLGLHDEWIKTGGKSGGLADLSNSDLESKNLEEANLEGANLEGSNFNKANLFRVNFKGALLNNADLSGAVGLTEGAFPQAELSGCSLPDAIGGFTGLDVIEEVSKNTKHLFITIMVSCVYSWVAIFTAPDAGFISDRHLIILPLLNASMPVIPFFIAMPVILLCVFIYFHFYLHRLWSELGEMPIVFPDGKSLDKKVYPWLLNGLARKFFNRLSEKRKTVEALEEFISIFLAWWLVPITIFIYWLAYLRSHKIGGVLFIGGVFVFSFMVAISFYKNMKQTLMGSRDVSNLDGPYELHYKVGQFLMLFLIVILLTVANMGNKPQLERVMGNWSLDLRGADLERADLEEVNLQRADLRWAKLKEANLSNSLMHSAKLQNADLSQVNMNGAVLVNSRMKGANLKGADLDGTFLQGADLQGVTGLTQPMLTKACGDKYTTLPDGLSVPHCK